MSDFILTVFIEFSIKSYINSEIPRPWQKISLKYTCRDPWYPTFKIKYHELNIEVNIFWLFLGACPSCADKPRFGGPGTKKKACVMRFCRMRKLEEDHAQTNYPLNSPKALTSSSRPVSNMAKRQKPADIAAIKSEEIDIDDEFM